MVLIPRKGSYVYHEFGMKNTTGATWADVLLLGLLLLPAIPLSA